MSFYRKLTIILLSVLLSNIYTIAQKPSPENQALSRLLHLVAKMPDNQRKLDMYDSIAWLHENVDTTLKYSYAEYNLAKKLDNPRNLVRGLRFYGWSFYNKNNMQKATECLFEACIIADSIKFESELAICYHQLGNCYAMMNDYIRSDGYYQKALKIYESLGDSVRISDLYCNMGAVSLDYNLFDIANNYFRKAQAINIQLNDLSLITDGYYYLANSPYREYLVRKENTILHTAYLYAVRMLGCAQQLNTDSRITFRSYDAATPILLDMSQIVSEPRRTQLLDSAKIFIDRGLKIIKENGYEGEDYSFNIYQARYNIIVGRYSQAKRELDSITKTLEADTTDLKNKMLSELYGNYSFYYEKIGDIKNAYKYNQKRQKSEISNLKVEYLITSTQSRAQSEFDKKMREREIAELNREAVFHERIQFHRLLAGIIGLFVIGLIVFVILLLKNYKRQKALYKIIEIKNEDLEQHKEELSAQNESLCEQKNIIEAANQEIRSSIEYARRIQTAAMPSQEDMEAKFGECLIFFKPLNIVSGDFYWNALIGRYKAIVVGDCTGHGVPGAFMSMLGLSQLNNIAAAFNNLDQVDNIKASDILNLMRDNIKKSLHQNNQENNTSDGMDIALCLIDTQKLQLQYAGAFRPMIIIRNDQIIEYSGDRMPVGIHINEKESFTNHMIDICKDDVIYLFTDGITDQFGFANKCCKFTAKRLRSLLLEIHDMPFAEQKVKINNTLYTWRRQKENPNVHPCEQTDDILLIGLRI